MIILIDDNNDCDRDKEYDGSSKDYDLVLQEIGSSSEEGEDDDDDEQEVNNGIEDAFCSRVGRLVTTFRSRRFFGDYDSGKPMFSMYVSTLLVLVRG